MKGKEDLGTTYHLLKYLKYFDKIILHVDDMLF